MKWRLIDWYHLCNPVHSRWPTPLKKILLSTNCEFFLHVDFCHSIAVWLGGLFYLFWKSILPQNTVYCASMLRPLQQATQTRPAWFQKNFGIGSKKMCDNIDWDLAWANQNSVTTCDNYFWFLQLHFLGTPKAHEKFVNFFHPGISTDPTA